LELFAGTGLFTLGLRDIFQHVLAVEQEPRSAADAVHNAVRNAVRGIEWIRSPVDRWLQQRGSRCRPDFLLVDPPREGLSKIVSRWALEAKPPRMVYVSCSPPTLARDLKRWCAQGEYELVRLVGLDLFPQTFHIETVAVLEKATRG
jgi:23S rRNA (uracil1939-C5)-methyltransferase